MGAPADESEGLVMRFTEWDREDCAEHGHHWVFHRRSPWTYVSECTNCDALQVEDIEHEEETA